MAALCFSRVRYFDSLFFVVVCVCVFAVVGSLLRECGILSICVCALAFLCGGNPKFLRGFQTSFFSLLPYSAIIEE